MMLVPSTIWGLYLISLTEYALYDNKPIPEVPVVAIPSQLRENPRFRQYIQDENVEQVLELLLRETRRSMRPSGEDMVYTETTKESCPILFRNAVESPTVRQLRQGVIRKAASLAGKAVGAGVGMLLNCMFKPSLESEYEYDPPTPKPVLTHSSSLLRLKPPQQLRGRKSIDESLGTLLKSPTAIPMEDLDTDDEDSGWFEVNVDDDDDFESIELDDALDDEDYVDVTSEDSPLLEWEMWMESRMRRRGIEYISPRELTRGSVRQISTATILSRLSYHSQEEMNINAEPEIRTLLKEQAPGFPIFIDGDVEYDTQAYLWLSDSSRTLYVAFRGTQSWTDVIHDLDYRVIPWDDERPDIRVHAGFRNKLRSIEEELLAITQEFEDQFDKIVVTGHSLGGALATLASPSLGEAHPNKTLECITFGAPRVGNEIFVQWFHSYVDLSLRIVNDFDPVQSLPFEAYYHHVNHAISLSETGELSKVPDTPVGKRVWNALEDLDFSRFLRDHDLKTYIARINSLLKKHN